MTLTFKYTHTNYIHVNVTGNIICVCFTHMQKQALKTQRNESSTIEKRQQQRILKTKQQHNFTYDATELIALFYFIF